MNLPPAALFAALLLLAATATVAATATAAATASAADADDRNHKKRQIYREQVLPHAGGRIPETAFETDRLFLNHLQKEGIAVPDGIVLEQRNPQVYPFLAKSSRSVYRIALSSDGRYTAQAGRYHYQSPPSIETTYLYPQIHGQQIHLQPPSTAAPHPPQPPPALPIYRQFQLHNPQLNQLKLQPKKKAHNLNVTPTHVRLGGKGRVKAYKSESYQNFNLLNTPLVGVASAVRKPTARGYSGGLSGPSGPSGDSKHLYHHYLPHNYGTSAHLFNEFDDLFSDFNLHESGGGGTASGGGGGVGGGDGAGGSGRSFPKPHAAY